MLIHDLKVALAHAKRQALHSNQDIAILFNRKTNAVLGTATGLSAAGPNPGTAVVNLLQNYCETGGNTRDMEVAVTSVPTALCFGMARVCQIKRVIYLRDGKVYFRTTDGANISDENQAVQGNKFSPDPEPPEGWKTNPAGADLESWALTVPPTVGIANMRGMLDQVPWRALPPRNLRWPESAPMPGLPVQPLQQFADAVFMLLAFAILSRLRHVRGMATTRSGGMEGHNIACVMVNSYNRIIGWGINTSELNATHHGEVNCIQNFQARHGIRAVPFGSRLYTTLEPCWMCSGMLARVTDGRFTVIHGQADGLLEGTALQDGAPGCSMHATELRYDKLQTWGAQIAASQPQGEPTTRFLDSEVAAGFFNQALVDLNSAFARFVPASPQDPHLPMHSMLVQQATGFLAGLS